MHSSNPGLSAVECSQDLVTNNERVLIHNDGDNMSDHLAISCALPVSVLPDVLKYKK